MSSSFSKLARERLVELVEPHLSDMSMARLTLELEYLAAEHYFRTVQEVYDRFLEFDDDLAELFDWDCLRHRASLKQAQGELAKHLGMERDAAQASFDEALARLVSHYQNLGLLTGEQCEEAMDG